MWPRRKSPHRWIHPPRRLATLARRVLVPDLGGDDLSAAKTTSLLKILFVGYGRSGKDEAAQFCESHLSMSYGGSTSWAAKEDVARELGVHPMTAWETRHKNREFWKSYCDYLRRDNPSLLIERSLSQGNVIAGIRDKVEFIDAVQKKLFDCIVWVERPGTPVDPTVTFTKEDVLAAGGVVLLNNGDLKEYHRKIVALLYRPEAEANSHYSGYALSLL